VLEEQAAMVNVIAPHTASAASLDNAFILCSFPWLLAAARECIGNIPSIVTIGLDDKKETPFLAKGRKLRGTTNLPVCFSDRLFIVNADRGGFLPASPRHVQNASPKACTGRLLSAGFTFLLLPFIDIRN
jgi:hypothetical protein